ncbi:MAG: hypothetical protein NVS1B12_06970 [Acidimicrobiales bacterium]
MGLRGRGEAVRTDRLPSPARLEPGRLHPPTVASTASRTPAVMVDFGAHVQNMAKWSDVASPKLIGQTPYPGLDRQNDHVSPRTYMVRPGYLVHGPLPSKAGALLAVRWLVPVTDDSEVVIWPRRSKWC